MTTDKKRTSGASRQISDKKLTANRQNAQKSTGPKTAAGKSKSRWNSLKHGLRAKEVVIPTTDNSETEAAFIELLGLVRKELDPQGVLEEMQVETIAVCYWRLRRARRCETGEIKRQFERASAEIANRSVLSDYPEQIISGRGWEPERPSDSVRIKRLVSVLEDVNEAINDSDDETEAVIGPEHKLRAMIESNDELRAMIESDPGLKAMTESDDGLQAMIETNDALKETIEELSEWRVARHPGNRLKECLREVSVSEINGTIGGWCSKLAQMEDDPRVKLSIKTRRKWKEFVLQLIDDEMKRLKALLDDVEEREMREAEARLESLALPSSEFLKNISRYETTIERQMYRAMNELARLQRQRKGPPSISE